MPASKDKEPKTIVAAKRVFDVAKPGATPADSTSRPIIVGHKSTIKDPMMSVSAPEKLETEKPKETEPEVSKPLQTPSQAKKVITPPSQLNKPEDAKPEEKPKEIEPETIESTDAAIVDAVLDQAKKKPGETTDAELEKQKQIEKLIESKKYFLAIGTPQRARNAQAITFLVLIVGSLGFLLAIDAEVVRLGFDLPFDLIK